MESFKGYVDITPKVCQINIAIVEILAQAVRLSDTISTITSNMDIELTKVCEK